MYMIYEKVLIFGFLSLLVADFAVRYNEQILPIHHSNATGIPPLGSLQHW